MNTRAVLATLSLAWALPSLCGCTPEIRIDNPEAIALTPKGKMAVLKVTARERGKPLSLALFWGIAKVPRAPESFAGLLAQVAREEGGMDVIPQREVAAALEKAELEYTLDPAPRQLGKFIDALGCEGYLTAHVEMWRSTYVAFHSKSTVRFVFSCWVAGAEEPLWSVHVRRARRGVRHRPLAASALQDAFRAVNAQRASLELEQ